MDHSPLDGDLAENMKAGPKGSSRETLHQLAAMQILPVRFIALSCAFQVGSGIYLPAICVW